jgi:hypothetical protein
MILSFVEHIERPTVIVRVGEQTTDGNPYLRSVFGARVARGWLELKGYSQDVPPVLFGSVMRTLYRDGFRVVQFDRLNHRPRTLFLTLAADGVSRVETVFH